MAAEPSHNKLALKEQSLRLGGARADFVASLGRRVAVLKSTLDELSKDRGSTRLKGELHAKLSQLSSGAKMLKFHAMDRALSEAMATLGRSSGRAPTDTEMQDIEQVLEDLPALAWGDERVREPLAARVERTIAPTYSALVVGQPLLAEALLESREGAPTFGCECIVDTQAAFDRAVATEPDLIVVDADLDYASELVEALMDDAHTEASPIVVVGSFLDTAIASRFVAMGVAKTLSKPTSREMVRTACEDALEPKAAPSEYPATFGEPTLRELSERLASELKSALAGDSASLDKRVALGDGTEVLSALWSAIARVREVVTARTDGAVRFARTGPEGAMTIGSPLQEVDVARADRLRARARGNASEVRLAGRRVVIADDDPAVVWFLADLLKSAGCIVQEAFDGRQALELCYRTSPDLVISDIVMPNLDGFSLCRALRRDVALHDVPVVLISWKEDLLSRVRELGAGAAGYVRKESDTRAIVARVREALRPRTRIEARLREGGEVRGRLDGVSVRTLLEIVCAMRPDARVSIRDASFLYELEIREGAPQRAIRADGDGNFLRGMRALSSMLGISAGRFTVATSTAFIDADLDGNLASQMSKPVARARAATALLVGPPSSDRAWQLARTARVELDEELLESYLRATPQGPKALAERLARGTNLRALAEDGQGALIEDLVSDLASRGAITAVLTSDGTDLLEQAVAAHLALADARSSFAPRTLTPIPASTERVREERAREEVSFAELEDFAPCAVDPAPFCESPLPPAGHDSAHSLEDAVKREIDSRSPVPAPVSEIAFEAPALVEPSTLRPRASVPAIALAPSEDAANEAPLALLDETAVDDTHYGEASVPLAAGAPPEDFDDLLAPEDLVPPSPLDEIPSELRETPCLADPEPEAVDLHEATAEPAVSEPIAKTPFTAVTDDAPAGVPVRTKKRVWPIAAALAVTGLATWGALQAKGDALSKVVEKAPLAETELASEPTVDVTPLADGVVLAPGMGVLDVSAEGDVVIVVDGTPRGRNAAALPLAAGVHDVRVEGPSGSVRRTLTVADGLLTRARF